jgi:CTP:molybdopterin cytidylyltransferase MocA
MTSGVVPAAGAASRFGGDKLVAAVDGIPMLDRTIGALLDAGIDDVIVVVAPGTDWPQARRLDDPRVRSVENPDPSRGMFSSIQIGLRAAMGSPVAVIPADMPFVRPETVRAVVALAEQSGGIASPRLDRRRGHPVVLPLDVLDAVLAAPATARLNDTLRLFATRFREIDVDDPGVVRDVDVVEDLARAKPSGQGK